MKSLFNDPSLIIMSVMGVLFLAGIVYNILVYFEELDQFRSKLKPGDRVKVKTQQDVFFARIVSIHDEYSVFVRNIDSRETIVTPSSKIYKP